MNGAENLRYFKFEIGITLILGVIVLLAYLFFFQVSGQAVAEKDLRWKETRRQMETLLRQKKTEKDLEQFSALLDSQRNYAEVINGPMNLAKKYHLTVPSVIYQKDRVEQEFTRVSFAFSVIGAYESIREFIASLESAKALYVIEDLSLSKSSKEGNQLELQIKMTTLLKNGS